MKSTRNILWRLYRINARWRRETSPTLLPVAVTRHTHVLAGESSGSKESRSQMVSALGQMVSQRPPAFVAVSTLKITGDLHRNADLKADAVVQKLVAAPTAPGPVPDPRHRPHRSVWWMVKLLELSMVLPVKRVVSVINQK
ncbi:hypothetical protein J6590_060959 [Homalodisca vitripennis]|nr:hypothetical protein J6590_060959 [Homalodisca vitripennis]